MRQYLKHFWIFFLIVAVVCSVCLSVYAVSRVGSTVTFKRSNSGTTDERVFDQADVLTEEEENKLRELIAKEEVNCGCDIVILTVNEPDINTESGVMNMADDFYDQARFGFDKPCGDGCLYLDNWGSGYYWFSTCGKVEAKYSSGMIDGLTSGINNRLSENASGPYGYTGFYDAYAYYVTSVSRTMQGHDTTYDVEHPVLDSLLAAFVIALIYVFIGLSHTKAKVTVNNMTYVKHGSHVFNDRRDVFLSKHTTRRTIQTSSGGGGGGGGYGGHHISSGGISHGGGGGHR